MVELLLEAAGLGEHPVNPVIRSREDLRALDERLLEARREDLERWQQVKGESWVWARYHVLD